MIMTRKQLAFAALAGIIPSLALPPLPLAGFAWIGLVPLLYALEDTEPRQAALIGFVSGFIYQLGALYWVGFHVAIPRGLAIVAMILAATVMALGNLAAAWAARYSAKWIGNKWPWAFLAAWVSVEYLRLFTEFAFPWTNIAHTQVRFLGIIQQADIWGVFGVSFWVVLLNVLAYEAIKSARTNRAAAWRYAGTFLIVIAVAITYGRWRLAEIPTKPRDIRIALVQPNLSMDIKWHPQIGLRRSRDILDSLTMGIDSGSVDLVMWPETAIPTYLVYVSPEVEDPYYRTPVPNYLGYLRRLVEHVDVPMVIGSPVYDYRRDKAFNSGVVISPDSIPVQSYDKRALVPFGERVPYDQIFGFLEELNLGMAHWSPGERANVLETPTCRIGIGVCLESVFPDLMRELVHNGADILVVLTNDAWFGNTSLIYQHAEYAAFRAIENRIWIARNANTGISCFVDPWGRITGKIDVFETGVLIDSVGRRERETVYSRWGNWLPQACLLGIVILLIGSWWNGSDRLRTMIRNRFNF